MKKAKILVAVAVLSFVFSSIISAQATGKDIFINGKCNTCHAIQSQDITSKQADKYPDLSNAGNCGLNEETMTKYLNKEYELNGKKHPVKFKGTEQELKTLVEWLLSLKTE